MNSSNASNLIGDNKKYFAVCIAFLALFIVVLLFRGHLHAFDLAVNSWVPTIQTVWATTIATGVSYAFDTYSLLFVSLVIAGYLFYKNYRLQSLILLGAMGGDALLVAAFKTATQSPRPENMLIYDSGYSFPSGHTVGSIVFFGVLTYFAWQYWKTKKQRIVMTTLATALVSVICFDRVYLNVHWFSDVLGGCLMGIFWLTLCLLIFNTINADKTLPSQRFNKLTASLFVISVIVGAGLLIDALVPMHSWINVLTSSLHTLTNTVALLTVIGYVGIFIVIFAESGFFIGFFLPGDSMLFTAGILAGQGFFNIYTLTAVVIAGAVLGDSFGYAFGRKVGPMFVKRESRFLNTKRVESVKVFFEKHGSKTIVIARFVPVARTFAPILAGASKMKYRTFLSYNVVGGLLWGLTMPLVGYVAGVAIPDIHLFIYPIIVIIVLISVLPWIIKILKTRTINL